MNPKLHQIAKALVAPGKGILAADERPETIKDRFDQYGIEDSPENHRVFRQILFTTPGIEEFISGIILHDDSKSFTDVLNSKGIKPGIKVDLGTEAFGDRGEVVTKGIENEEEFRERLKEYRRIGEEFTKWRAIITIGEGIPTDKNIQENTTRIARFAKISQEEYLVPIVEAEVLMDGDHTIEKCFDITKQTLKAVFEHLEKEEVGLPGILLKPNMIVPGKESNQKIPSEEVARLTLQCLKEAVPPQVPGIVFLSGGQSDEEAIRNLAEMNKTGSHPWELSFSFGRGLQQAVYEALDGKLNDPERIKSAQQAFYDVAKQCGAARFGKTA